MRQLRFPESVRLELLTNLDESNLSEGVVDSGAIHWLCEQVPNTSVRHLRYLHAKAYIADNHTAIVTSANLTNGGLWGNYELGVVISEPLEVMQISNDLKEYGQFGVLVPLGVLTELDDLANVARESKGDPDESQSNDAQARYFAALNEIRHRLTELRTVSEEFTINPRASTTAKFADAVTYILRRNGPLPTREINPLIQQLMPEWCDDNIERVIRGVPFGKKWKHHVRNAQAQLRRSGVIVLEDNRWRLVKWEN